MERGLVTFAILFLLLPVLLFGAAWLVASAWGVLLLIAGLLVLAVGFTVAIATMSL